MVSHGAENTPIVVSHRVENTFIVVSHGAENAPIMVSHGTGKKHRGYSLYIEQTLWTVMVQETHMVASHDAEYAPIVASHCSTKTHRGQSWYIEHTLLTVKIGNHFTASLRKQNQICAVCDLRNITYKDTGRVIFSVVNEWTHKIYETSNNIINKWKP